MCNWAWVPDDVFSLQDYDTCKTYEVNSKTSHAQWHIIKHRIKLTFSSFSRTSKVVGFFWKKNIGQVN